MGFRRGDLRLNVPNLLGAGDALDREQMLPCGVELALCRNHGDLRVVNEFLGERAEVTAAVEQGKRLASLGSERKDGRACVLGRALRLDQAAAHLTGQNIP